MKMKKITITFAVVSIALLSLFTLTNSVNSTANTPPVGYPAEIYDFEDESYVDDIPFSTISIASNSIDFYIEDEPYIDDIPFDTKKIVEAL